MASHWTDDRMDDLKAQVETLSQRTDDGFRDLRSEMSDLRSEMRGEMRDLRMEMAARLDRMDVRFDAMDARFDAMQRVLIMFGASMFVAMMGIIATLIAFQL